jgi:general stress protein 26
MELRQMDTVGTERKRLFEMLRDFDTAMLLTHSADGAMHARPMAVAELQPNGDAYFAAQADSPKIAEIQADPRVVVTFQSRSQFASVAGRAELVRDRVLIEKLWSEAWRVWFPGGKDDPSLCLIWVAAETGEYWDNAGAQGIKYAFEAAKAYATGETPKLDRELHAKVNL